MKPIVVIGYPGFGDIEIERKILRDIDAQIIHTKSLDTPEAEEAVRQAHAVMVTVQPVSRSLIQSMEQCRLICRVGTGLDAIDIPAATAKGIWVTYVADYSIDEVSAHAIAFLMAHARGLPDLIQSTRNGQWNGSIIEPRQRLRGLVLGLLGYGRIGQAVAEKARGLGVRVIAHDPYLAATGAAPDAIELVDLETLLRTADYLSLHMPLTADNRKIINRDTLAQMKPSAFLINTARGPLIDEDALLEAVRSGQIAGAAVDVLEQEPPAPDHPFLHEERIWVTPHSAWYSEAAKVDVRHRGAEEVVRVLSNTPPRMPANQIDVPARG
jgi:D-3-phosphoglycerate dehydrogenase / 2-oxoglutarate reductase